MTEKETKQIAQQLYKLMKRDIQEALAEIHKSVLTDHYDAVYNSREAAEFLRMSLDQLKHKIDDIPHHQSTAGGKLLFFRSELINYIRQI